MLVKAAETQTDGDTAGLRGGVGRDRLGRSKQLCERRSKQDHIPVLREAVALPLP